jgi:hypothetical protein
LLPARLDAHAKPKGSDYLLVDPAPEIGNSFPTMTSLLAALLGVAVVSPAGAFQEEARSRIEATREASSAAVEAFLANEDRAVQDAFTGYKAWPDGADVRVKFLLSAEDFIRYTCRRAEAPADDSDAGWACRRE